METKNVTGAEFPLRDDRGVGPAERGQPEKHEESSFEGVPNVCHLQCLESFVHEISFSEKLYRRIVRGGYSRARRFVGAVRGLLQQTNGGGPLESPGNSPAARPGPVPPLGLKPGERVMVKPYDEIVKTLDANGKYQGLSFTIAQRKYCGGTYTVLKRLEKVFDERRWKLWRVRDTVLLEGVVCDGSGGIFREWDGCDRTCLLWWKEAWLKRTENAPAGSGPGLDGLS